MLVTKQSLGSIFRQIFALGIFVFGALTAGLGSIHLPTPVSAIMTITGALILSLEHYFGDPSVNAATNPLIQRVSAVLRQICAIASTVFGILSASTSSLHLPTTMAVILTSAGPVILAIEHYVANPSTGNVPSPQNPPLAA